VRGHQKFDSARQVMIHFNFMTVLAIVGHHHHHHANARRVVC
jgi:hypothetical protein